MLAVSLEETLPPDCEALQLITSTLHSTQVELNQLKRVYRTLRIKKGRVGKLEGVKERKEAGKEKMEVCIEDGRIKKSPKVDASRRRRVGRFAVIMNLLLLLVLLIAWVMEPRCCDTYSNLSFGPHLRYINGPPPI